MSSVPKPKTVGVEPEALSKRLADIGLHDDVSATQSRTGSGADASMPWYRAVPRWPFLALIKLYQKTLSLDHGPLSMFMPYGFCRFHPTCSQYGYDAIKRRGVVAGLILTAWRIMRCNPISKGGLDEVPEKGLRKRKNK